MDPDASVSGSLVIAIEIGWAVVSGDQQIKIAVAIEIAIGKPASDLWLTEAAADFSSHVDETFPFHCSGKVAVAAHNRRR